VLGDVIGVTDDHPDGINCVVEPLLKSLLMEYSIKIVIWSDTYEGSEAVKSLNKTEMLVLVLLDKATVNVALYAGTAGVEMR